MNKLIKKIMFMLLFSLCLLDIPIVWAEDKNETTVSIDDVLVYMSDQNIYSFDSYLNSFGKILNGNKEYDMESMRYDITKDKNTFTIKTYVIDKISDTLIESSTTFNYTDTTISYTNTHPSNSLESRIDSLLLTEIMHSIGAMKGIPSKLLIDWMNQIPLESGTLAKDGFEGTFEKITYKTEINNKEYTYITNVPRSYQIDINKLTNEMPESTDVYISFQDSTTSKVKLYVSTKEETTKKCNVYKKNNKTNEFNLLDTVDCNGSTIEDKNLESGTTYTYQVKFADEIMCGTEVTATTKTPIIPEIIPDTGNFFTPKFFILTAIAITGSITLYILYIKKSKMYKI